MKDNVWTAIEPEVNSSAEFFEIVNDFGNPMELVREAISNAIDWKASQIKISFNGASCKSLDLKRSEHGQAGSRLILQKKSMWSNLQRRFFQLRTDCSL